MSIFRHMDSDEDEIEVLAGSYLEFHVGPRMGGGDARCYVDREAALRLHAALGDWLYPTHTPEGPNRSLIEQMIERNVREQITAILPVHLNSQRICTRDESCEVADPEPGDVGHPEPAEPYQAPLHMVSQADCKVAGCTYRHLSGIHGRVESEPEHGRLMAQLPRRTRARVWKCWVCLHGWGEHTGGICWGALGCECTQGRPSAAGTP